MRHLTNSLLIVAFSSLICITTSTPANTREKPFDPNDCYEPGTIFEENEKNLGFCPCKYGYYGPFCFDIFDCVIGELRTDNCSREFRNDYDLQWRCAASKKSIVKICTCPEGFRGETCEFILENTLSTYWQTAKQSQKFFEVVYNRSHSFVRLAAAVFWQKIVEYRRLFMFLIFMIILEIAWRHAKRTRKACAEEKEMVDVRTFNNFGYNVLPPAYDMEAELPLKQKLEENRETERERTTVVQISDETNFSRPTLHI